jgi:putative Mn2+ efflux pump MntP
MGIKMNLSELFILAVGLSADAFGVSVCKGLSVKQVRLKHAIIAGLYFGGFQALMPFLGYLLGSRFEGAITNVDHWIAVGLLSTIGIKMLWEARGGEEKLNESFSVKTMLPLAIATSIDALAVGVTFAFLPVSVVWAISFIGVTTFLFSAAGIKIGNKFGAKYKSKAEIFGGVVLIVIGTKILLEHLEILF